MKIRQRRPQVLSLAILLLCIACHRAADGPTPADTPPVRPPAARPTSLDSRPAPSPGSLVCQEHGGDDLFSWQRWRSEGSVPPGLSDPYLLATDGDLLWASTNRGLVRLNARTGECTLFTRAAGHSLAGIYLLLPDGQGGLWASFRHGLLRFSGERWQMAYGTPSWGVYPRRIHALGLLPDGDLCIGLVGGRFGAISLPLCFAGNTLPLTGAHQRDDLALTGCDRWERVTAGNKYAASPACEEKQLADQWHMSTAVWMDGQNAWAIEQTDSEMPRLIHRQGETVQEIEMPYHRVRALAADPIQDGVWLATEGGLVHGEFKTAARGCAVSAAHFLFQPWDLDVTPSPGSVRRLAVEESGQVWAIGGRGVLRYDESNQAWHLLLSMPHGADAIAPDPLRGIWVAGEGKLWHFDGARWHTWPLPGDPAVIPTTLLIQENGRLWVGALKRGIWTALMSPSSAKEGETPGWRAFTASDGLTSEWITHLARGPDGRLYAAHHAGISVFDPTPSVEDGRWTSLPGSDPGEGRWVNRLALDTFQGRSDLWAGVYPGSLLRRYRDGHWTDYLLDEGERGEAMSGISALLATGDGDLWVGTPNGLWRATDAREGEVPRWQGLDPELYGRQVLALAQDTGGRIWVSGGEGITRVSLKKVRFSRPLPSIRLSCRQGDAEETSWQVWRNTPLFDRAISDVSPGGLVSDSDTLWISTLPGLIRLNTRTWECAVWTKAAGVSLAKAHPLKLDGEGGLWAGVPGNLLRLSNGQWQVAYEIPSEGGYLPPINLLALSRDGDLCVETRAKVPSFCFAGSSPPLKPAYLVLRGLDPTACDRWQWMAGGGHNYGTPAACQEQATLLAQGYSPIVVLAEDNGTRDEKETWLVERTTDVMRLFRRQGETVAWVETPHQTIQALAADPVYGGIWLATEYWVYHSATRTIAGPGGVPSTAPVLQPFPSKTEALPGSIHGLAVEKSGQVWAIGDRGVLRYDEPNQAWRPLLSIPHSADAIAIAPDPLRGIWVAGAGELWHFDGARWHTWPLPGDPAVIPTTLLAQENGRLWVGTLKRGIWTAVMSPSSAEEEETPGWRAFTAGDGLASEWITHLARGPDGRLYAAHHAGISAFDPTPSVEDGRWTSLPGSDPGEGRWVNRLAFDTFHLWAGIYPGSLLRRYRDGHWTDYLLDEGEHGEAMSGISALLATGDGNLWAGTPNGLWQGQRPGAGKSDAPGWQRFDPTPAVGPVLALARDLQGSLWAGGQEGIALWKGGR